MLTSLALDRWVSSKYAQAPKTVALILVPLALLWAVASPSTSRITLTLAIAFYAVLALVNWLKSESDSNFRHRFQQSIYLYPALGLVPVWMVYCLNGLLPLARHEHYGLLLLVFARWA